MNELKTELRTIVSVGVGGAFPQEAVKLAREAVESHGGWFFRQEIEGLWASFPSPREAFRSVLEMARKALAQDVRLRFGLHLGDVTVTAQGDVLGHTLSVAKRLETAASPYTAMLSSEIMERLGEETADHKIVMLPALMLKGIGALDAFQLELPMSAQAAVSLDWQSWHRRELLFCLVGPLGGEEEMAQLLDVPPQHFYEAAEERQAEVGEAEWRQQYQHWCQELPPRTALVNTLNKMAVPCLAFFPDPRLLDRTVGEQPVLCESQLEQFWKQLPRLLEGYELALTSHLVVWIGPAALVDLFYREVRRRFPAGPEQPQWALIPPLKDDEALVGRWKRWGLHCLNLTFHGTQPLEALLASFKKHAQTDPVVHTPDGCSNRPYKFLDAYQPQDQGIFFGRERESAILHSWIMTRPWLVLFGRSGVGKSSLLGAGVFPRLTQSQVTIWVVRCLHDPVEQLAARCQKEWPGDLPPPASLAQGLTFLAQQRPPRLVIVFDQFEEFFLRLAATQRRSLGRLIQQLVHAPVHLLFSLREDFLAEMAELEEWVPTLLDSRFRLSALTREQARQSIVGPAAVFTFTIEDALVEALLNELESEGVEPPELQIVMDRLYDLRQDDHLSLECYRRLGGVRSILQGYLNSVVENQLVQGPWPPDLPRRVLRAMVSKRGTRLTVTLKTLAQELGVPIGLLPEILKKMILLRLARSWTISLEGEAHYELSHEYLIEEILSWASEEEMSLRHAQMILQSEWESWENLGSLIAPERLQIVVSELERLHPSTEEVQLLVRGSMFHGIDLGLRLGEESVPWLLALLDDCAAFPRFERGVVQRRILRELAGRELAEQGQQRFLQAAQEYANPSLLADTQPLLGEALGQALERAIESRFFGSTAMVTVESGPAWLGSTAELREQRKLTLPTYWHARIDSEKDLRQVELEAFRIDLTPVRNIDFAEFRPAHVNRFPESESDHPVVSVSWHDAQAYANWLGKQLVDEDRWEKAARGSDGRLFPWGQNYEIDRLNCKESGLPVATGVFEHPRGASPYGCLDMAGNVWEWTASSWSEGGPFKVQKGGSTLNPQALQHASSRMEAFPDFVLQWVGFRLMAPGADRGR